MLINFHPENYIVGFYNCRWTSLYHLSSTVINLSEWIIITTRTRREGSDWRPHNIKIKLILILLICFMQTNIMEIRCWKHRGLVLPNTIVLVLQYYFIHVTHTSTSTTILLQVLVLLILQVSRCRHFREPELEGPPFFILPRDAELSKAGSVHAVKSALGNFDLSIYINLQFRIMREIHSFVS